MQLSELIGVLPFALNKKAFEQIEIKAIETDSRKVLPGSLFVCIKGFTTDGHLYIQDAVRNGAVAVVSEEEVTAPVPIIQVQDTARALAMLVGKYYDYPTSNLPLIGVTGTNGKTTVTYLLDEIYRTHKKKTGIIGTIQTKIGDAIFDAKNTTPDALALQQTFKQMRAQEVEQVIMEVSSHALDLGRVYGCDFDTVIFTNLSQDHLDYHGDLNNYLRVKSLLFAQLGNSYNGKRKTAVINGDDPSSELIRKSTAQFVLTYGIEYPASVMAEDIKLLPEGTSFKLKTPVGTVKITSRLIGKFNIYNMLAAASAAIANHISLATIKEAFRRIQSIPGRLEIIDEGQDFTVLVDYAHTPDALRNLLETCREITLGKMIVVIGCGGERDRKKRPLMASEAVRIADHVIFTSDNPRKENPDLIIHDMITGLKEHTHCYDVSLDRNVAIHQAIRYAEPGDTVIIAGKGHETYQEINGKRYPFDDRAVARAAILA